MNAVDNVTYSPTSTQSGRSAIGTSCFENVKSGSSDESSVGGFWQNGYLVRIVGGSTLIKCDLVTNWDEAECAGLEWNRRILIQDMKHGAGRYW